MIAIILILLLGAILVPLDYSREVDNGGEDSSSYEHYVENWEDVGAKNLVAGILTDWRAYDTMGEAIVLVTALLGFYVLLRGGEENEDVGSG